MNRQYTTLLLVLLLLTGFIREASAVWIAGWESTNQMNTARAGAAVLEVNGVIYALGGVDGRKFLNTTEYSKIQPNGTLGTWKRSALLNDARGFFDAVAHNGFIYAVGGGKGENGKVLLRSIERTRITESGSLEGWVTERFGLNYPRRCVKLFIANKRVYALGGFSGALLDSVESAPINEDGSLGEWHVEKTPLTMTRYINSVEQINETAYVIGGHAEQEGTGVTEVEYANTTSGGGLMWRKTSAMQAPRYALSSASWGNYLYAIGGLNGASYTDEIELAVQGPEGELGSWRYTTPLSSQRANFGSVVYQGRIYIIGGTNRDGYYRAVDYASINEDGDIGFNGTAQQLETYRQQQLEKKAKPKRKLPNSGIVAEVFQTKAYSYLRVTKGVTEQWLAGSRSDFKIGETVEYSRGTAMVNFHSSTLNREFSSIIFVEHLRRADGE